MTDDLVKRLRLYAYCDDWINKERKEAADEIERLKERIKDLEYELSFEEVP